MARHLIHIGYPKAGSTFLQAWFARHPQLCYTHGGLGGFQNVYEIARPAQACYQYYVTSFEGLATPQKSAGGINLAHGGVVPDTNDRTFESQKRVCTVLKTLYPGSRVLIVTRGFRGMIASGYSQYVRMGGTLPLDGMCRRLATVLRDDTFHYYDFDRLIQHYSDVFGEENMIVMPFELLRDDQNRFLALLEEKLGLDHLEIELGPINQSLSPEELYWYPVISRVVSSAASRLGSKRYQRIYGWYVRKALDNRLRSVVSVLRRMKPGRRITDADFPAEILQYCQGKATQLKGNPLFAPYAAEYLWDS